MVQAITWLLLIELIGVMTLPLAFSVFRFLPERGYALAKPLGLLVAAYLVWFLSMLDLPFNALTSWLIFGIGFVALNVWLLWRQGGKLRDEMAEFVVRNRWLIVLCEVIFILAYAYLVWLRSYIPDIRDQEKFGDFAFLQSLTLYDKMPPADPWMSGYPINYYYFSHFMMAMLTKMTGIDPAISFNLTIPLIFAMTALAAFGLVYNLVSIARKKLSAVSYQLSAISPSGIAIAFGLLALFMICLMGNLDPVRQIFFPRPEKYETGLNAVNGFTFSWWTPSRVISDYMPIPVGGGQVVYQWEETINEFPMFSFLLADMHPHVMTLPTALLVISFGLAMLTLPAGLPRSDRTLFFVTAAAAIGGLYFLNTWDYPTYLLLFVLAALIRERLTGRQEIAETPQQNNPWLAAGKVALLGGPLPHPRVLALGWGQFARWLGFSLRLVALSLALYLPFHLTFISLVGDYSVPEPIASIPILGTLGKMISFVAWDRTPLLGYLLVFGVFVFPLVSFLVLKLWPYFKQPYAYLDEEGLQAEWEAGVLAGWGYYITGLGIFVLLFSEVCFFLLKLNAILCLVIGLVGIPIVATGAGMLAAEILAQYRPKRLQTELQIATVGAAALMIVGGWLVHFELYGFLIIAAAGSGLLLWFESRPSNTPATQETEVEDSALSTNPQRGFLDGQHSALMWADRFALLLIFLPAVITFMTELIIIRDVFSMRLNTLFKFYYQAWILYGLAAAYTSWRLIGWLWKLVPLDSTAGEDDTWDQEPALNLAPKPNPQPFAPAQLLLSPAGGPPMGNPGWAFNLTQLTNPAPDYTDDFEDLEAEEAEEYEMESSRKPWWRWLWVLGLGLLLLGGLIYPIFGPYEKTNHFDRPIGLDGSSWLRDGGRTGGPMPEDYQAIQWLKQQLAANRNFAGTILEASGPDWVDYSRVSTFSGLPTLLGWFGHENQWRGGKAFARTDTFDCGQLLVKYNLRPATPGETRSLQKDEPGCRLQLVDLLYSTTDAKLAQELLQATGVKYVYIGSIETGTNTGRSSDVKKYSPEALAKFGQFMKVIYQQNGVTIYSF